MTGGARKLGVLLLTGGLAWAGLSCKDSSPASGGRTRAGRNPYDDEYTQALAIANEFCHAWQKANLPDARALMSQRLLAAHPEDKIADLIGPRSNPLHVAYEISAGRHLEDGRIAFDVRFFYRYAGQSGHRIEGPLQQVVLARDDQQRWRVDDVPIP
jgi:hypothetical protein